MRSKLAFLFIGILGSYGLFAQLNPDDDEIFKEDEVTEIRITMSTADKELIHLEENRWDDIYVRSTVTFNNSELVNVSVADVGVRLRGNTARQHNKRSYKIDFKEFGGVKFESYKKLNLKPNVNDPAHIRELLTMHLFRVMDVPAPRVAPATLYINDEYMGVYLIIEQIDDEFVDKRFGKEVGWLYKCGYQATLQDNGQVFNQDLYQSKMNELTDTRSQLDNFVDVLNNTSNANFAEEIEKIFNVQAYLRYLAVEAITGHWDGYSYLNNNYYIYYDEDAFRFEFIAYDTDNTWGIDWIDRDWATRDLNHFHRHNNPRPLTSRILDVEAYRNIYYYHLNTLFDQYFTESYLYGKLADYKSLLSTHVQNDDYFDDSFGFTHSDFLNAFEFTSNQQAEYGLKDFIQTRRSTGIPSIPVVVLEAGGSAEVEAYPNPIPNGEFYVEMIGAASAHMKLTNLAGVKMTLNKKAVSENKVLLQSDLAPGIYLLQAGNVVKRLSVR